MINEAPSSLANNSAIAVGFALGVALFVVVGKVCGDADDDGGDETRSRLRTVSSANSVCSEAGHAPKSKLGMMKDSMCEADYEVVSEAPRFPRYPTTMVLAVLVDALCDGFLIGVAAASGTNAGLIMAIALTIEMGFLSLTFATTLRRQPRAIAFVSIALPPACLMLGGVLGAYYGGNPEKGCARVAESLGRCDSKEDDHGVLANDACKATCGTCPTTPTCENSASWFYKDEKRDCDWVAIKPDVRCAKEDDEDVSAYEACPTVCDASCAVADSTSWYYGKPSKNCDYIAEKTSRCSSKKDDDGIYAYEACPVACADAGEQDRKLLRGAN